MNKLCIALSAAAALVVFVERSAHAQAPSSIMGLCRGGAGYTDATRTQWQFAAGDTFPAGAFDGGCSFESPTAPTDPLAPIGGVFGSGGQLLATGDFVCGSGTLSGTGQLGLFDVGTESFNWNATFQNGVGSFTTTTTDGTPLSGTLVIVDGAPASCNDQLTTAPNPLPVGSEGITEPPLGILIFTLG